MWTAITGAPRPCWIRNDECLLDSGEPAFFRSLPPPQTLPQWLASPADSNLRTQVQTGGCSFEVRSREIDAQIVVDFYRAIAVTEGLSQETGLWVGRAGLGFAITGDEWFLSVDVCQHGKLAFWTIQAGRKVHEPPRRRLTPPYRLATNEFGAQTIVPGEFAFVSWNSETVRLRIPGEAEEIWAHVCGLRFTEPPSQPTNEEIPRPARISWASLPLWIQFDIPPGAEGEVYVDASGVWTEASFHLTFTGRPSEKFAACLASLDAFEFDPTCIVRPDHSYYVSILQQGHSLNIHVQSEAGDSATLTVLNTVGHLTLSIRYRPRPMR